MRRLKAVSLALMLVGVAGASCSQQEHKLKALSDEAATLYEQGNYERGVDVAMKALKLAQESLHADDPNVALSLNNTSDIFF